MTDEKAKIICTAKVDDQTVKNRRSLGNFGSMAFIYSCLVHYFHFGWHFSSVVMMFLFIFIGHTITLSLATRFYTRK